MHNGSNVTMVISKITFKVQNSLSNIKNKNSHYTASNASDLKLKIVTHDRQNEINANTACCNVHSSVHVLIILPRELGPRITSKISAQLPELLMVK